MNGKSGIETQKMTAFRPRLMEATTAAERMDALCEFIEYWLGPRRPSFGVSADVLATRFLPMPLKRLHEFAGQWPHWAEHLQPGRHVVPAFSHQDYLVAFSSMKEKDDKIVFLWENQGVWECQTLAEGDDPPVWCCHGNDKSKIVCDSLSRFLVTFVLQELQLESRLYLVDDALAARYESERSLVVPVWTNGSYAYEESLYNFFLWRDVLVCSSFESAMFAARSSEGVAFLEANQSPISNIGIEVGLCWELEIAQDGSGRVLNSRLEGDNDSYSGPGSFEFERVLSGLVAEFESGAHDKGPVVYLRRHGQHGGLRPNHLNNMRCISALFRRALECASVPHEELEREFAGNLGLIDLDPRWRTSTVVDLASTIRNECSFDRLPILADALMDAGCDNDEILAHCRQSQPHPRSCWVVDLLLA